MRILSSWPRRVLASAACMATAVGIGLFTIHEIDRWGGGLFPDLCALATISLLLIAAALPSPKSAKAVGRFVAFLLELLC